MTNRASNIATNPILRPTKSSTNTMPPSSLWRSTNLCKDGWEHFGSYSFWSTFASNSPQCWDKSFDELHEGIGSLGWPSSWHNIEGTSTSKGGSESIADLFLSRIIFPIANDSPTQPKIMGRSSFHPSPCGHPSRNHASSIQLSWPNPIGYNACCPNKIS